MKNGLRVVFAVVAMATVAMGADNTLGTWKYNTSKSKGARGVSPIASLVVTREAADGGAKITTKGARKDGTKIETVTNAKYDGTPVTVSGTGLTWDTVAVKQVDANTLTEERSKQGGKYHTTVRTVVAANGKTMTAATKGTGADGKPVSINAVFDKQ